MPQVRIFFPFTLAMGGSRDALPVVLQESIMMLFPTDVYKILSQRQVNVR
jgi:hypothetical protein